MSAEFNPHLLSPPMSMLALLFRLYRYTGNKMESQTLHGIWFQSEMTAFVLFKQLVMASFR